jgi:hypothetical protein
LTGAAKSYQRDFVLAAKARMVEIIMKNGLQCIVKAGETMKTDLVVVVA